MRAKDAWDRAAECAARIQNTTDPNERAFLIMMRDEWIEVATHFSAMEDRVLDKTATN